MLRFCIDPDTGSLQFPELGESIALLSRWKAFPETLRKMVRSKENGAMGWVTHHAGPFLMETRHVFVSFGFHGIELKSISFMLAGESESASLDVATEDEVSVLRGLMETQLKVELVEDGFTSFPWGKAVCCYHPKDGAVFAGIHAE